MEILRNPFFWVYLSGSAAGCSLGYLVNRLSKKKSGSTGFALFLSASLLAFSAGIILSPGFLNPFVLLLLPLSGALIIGFILGRFPFASIPLVLLILGSLYLLAYLPIQNEPGIAVHEDPLQISVLRFTDTGSVLELSHQGRSQLIKLGSEGFSVEAERIVLSPYLPWPQQEYLFVKRLVPDMGGALSLPDLEAREKKILLPGFVDTLADVMERLGLMKKEVLIKGPLPIRLLRSYPIDQAFFRS